MLPVDSSHDRVLQRRPSLGKFTVENNDGIALDQLLNAVGVSEEVVDQGLLVGEVNGSWDMATQVFVLVPAVYNHVILSALIQNLRQCLRCYRIHEPKIFHETLIPMQNLSLASGILVLDVLNERSLLGFWFFKYVVSNFKWPRT